MSVKQVIGGTFEDVSEAVIKPVVDEVGKAIEIGVTSIAGTAPKQNQTTQGPATDNKKLAEARWKIKRWQDFAEAQRKIREEEKMRQLQKSQVQQQVTQEKKLEEIYKKKENTALKQAQRKTEIRGGVGG